MKLIRNILGKAILFFDNTFAPTPVKRSAEAQAKMDQKTAHLALYQFHMCPFCVKVRRTIKRLNLNIELRDAKDNAQFAEELLSQGGKRQVPCLRIENEDGSVNWMYESDAINQYLEKIAHEA
ncbi:glutaredoxin family protein [Ignatzschineria cameli]|uniref:Glutaredoxin n=1 Tax=Ignatzschineria cameli TaxID=2182793 RepID=A0A2U2ATZ1_9GAMM|nr:glutaredoxin [Ignatzschineria cameli]PWD87336.1 glutaredoxin [Ignatzschineria cameli]PWD88176.1 glutaredoxin [Ignatzschineria cameli]PWD91206.1 glutaredoxin [Ignatzschineria cameli]PWD92847.1 glutaredoxin [Ignatzschineria cameli]PWD93868.1 glutaredoxin [Ignatzschineria cameli]